MKIAIVVGTFPTISETFIINQIISLIDKGHKVKIYALYKGNTCKVHKVITKYELLNKVTYKPYFPKNKIKRVLKFFKFVFVNFFLIDWKLLIKSVNFFKYGKKTLNLELFYESKWFLFKDKPDVVHVHFGVYAVNIAELKKKGFLSNSKFIVSFHGFDINPSKIEYYKTYYKTLLDQVDTITVNTLYTKNLLLKVKPNLKNIEILPVGLNTNLFKGSEVVKENDVFKILYCGRLVAFKGSNLTIDVVKELLNRGINNIELKIIGEGQLKLQLENKIKQFELEKFVSLMGSLTQEKIKIIMDNSNVFLLPGIYDSFDGRAENQGLVIQEAQSMELPVIVSDVGGMKYGLIENKTGFVVKENDIKGFADAIETLIKNPKLVNSMGKCGREFVKNNYDSNVLVDRLVSIYNL